MRNLRVLWIARPVDELDLIVPDPLPLHRPFLGEGYPVLPAAFIPELDDRQASGVIRVDAAAQALFLVADDPCRDPQSVAEEKPDPQRQQQAACRHEDKENKAQGFHRGSLA